MSDPTSVPIRHITESSTPSSVATHSPVNVPSYDILVPIPGDNDIDSDLLNIPRLLQTPLSVAEDRDGSVTVASILVVPSDFGPDELDTNESESGMMESVIQTAQQELRTFLKVADGIAGNVPVYGFVGVVDTPEAAFDKLATDKQYDAIFLAQNQTDDLQLWDEQTISIVLDTAQCAVYVENLGPNEDLVFQESSERTTPSGELAPTQTGEVLLAVGTGAHSVLGAETARAVAKASGAGIHALHLIASSDDGPTRQKGRKALSLAEYVLSDLPNVNCEMREVEDPIDELLAEMDQYDVSIIGAPTKTSLLGRLFGRSMPEKVMTGSNTSVITVQQPPEGMESVYYRWKRAVERTTDVDLPPTEEDQEI